MLLSGSMVNPKHDRVTLQDCKAITSGRFEEILCILGRAGADGSGGENSSYPRVRSVGAGCDAMILRDNQEGEWIQEEAWFASKVPDR